MSNPEVSKASGLAPSQLRPRKRRQGWLAALVLLIGAAGAWYWVQGEDEGPATEPLIATVEVGSIENTIAAAGSLQPSRYVDVGAQVSGQLQKLYVEVGDLVEEGQLLAEIDARVQMNRVEASRANIEALEAQIEARRAALELARANTERQKRLMDADATSQLDYDNAMNNLASAEAGLTQLEKQIQQNLATLASEETQLEFTRIYAPIAGTVVSIEMSEGRTLNANQQAPTILRIADLSLMTVETDVSEADIGSIRRGMPVYFTTLGGGRRRWEGQLRQVLPTPKIENNVVLYTGLFDVENPDGTLLPEMTAQVYFVTSSAKDVLTVPLGALTFTDAEGAVLGERMRRVAGQFPAGSPSSGAFPAGEARPGLVPPARQGGGTGPRRLATVQVVKEDGTTEAREVMIGVTSRVAAEVISGLRAGEKVIAGIIQTGVEAAPEDQGGFRGGPGAIRFRGGF